MVKIVICVDDVNNQEGYEPNENMLKLIEDYGVNFSCFIPASFRGQELTRDFVEQMVARPNFEICAHGLNHDREMDSMEFADLQPQEIKDKLVNMNQIWLKLGYSPMVYKSPGWCTPLYVYDILRELEYDIVCDHFQGVPTKYKEIWRIPYDYSIDNLPKDIENNDNVIVLQSHISPITPDGKNGNKNIWNETNTLKFRLWLDDLINTKTKVEFIKIGDIL